MHLTVNMHLMTCVLNNQTLWYRDMINLEENFGGGKIWWIHYNIMFGKIKFGKFVKLARY